MGRRSDHTRDELHDLALSEAQAIVVSQGLSGLSARKVAAGIGYTVGSLYLVFKNLDDLVLQLNERTVDELFHRAQQAVSGASGPRAAVFALGDVYIEFALNQRNRWLAVFEYRAGQVRPQLQDKVHQLFVLVEEQLRRLAPGRSDAEVRMAAQALWSGVHGVCILALSDKLNTVSSFPVKEVTRNLLTMYLRSFSA